MEGSIGKKRVLNVNKWGFLCYLSNLTVFSEFFNVFYSKGYYLSNYLMREYSSVIENCSSIVLFPFKVD